MSEVLHVHVRFTVHLKDKGARCVIAEAVGVWEHPHPMAGVGETAAEALSDLRKNLRSFRVDIVLHIHQPNR